MVQERELNYVLKVEGFPTPMCNFGDNTDTLMVAKVANKSVAITFAEAYAIAVIKDYTGLPVTMEALPEGWSISVSTTKNCFVVRYNDCITHAILIERICPHCGCNPSDEPYCMTATHCPKCGTML